MGFVIFGGGFAKRGVWTNPPNPPGYGPASHSGMQHSGTTRRMPGDL